MPYSRYALTKAGYLALRKSESAMKAGAAESMIVPSQMSEETLAAAETLLIELPQFNWTIEVDVLGHHRITIHFAGGSVDIDGVPF